MAHGQENWSISAFELVVLQGREVELVSAPKADVEEPLVVVARQWVDKRGKVRLDRGDIVPVLLRNRR